MIDRAKPPKGRICHSFGGLAWIEPNGVIHWIADGLSHPTWAYMHLNSLSGEPDTTIDHHDAEKSLIGSGWLRVSTPMNIEMLDINDLSQDAWDSWASIVAPCLTSVGDPEPNVMIGYGPEGLDYKELLIPDAVDIYCSKKAQEDFWRVVMNESLVRKLVREMLLIEDRDKAANLAKNLAIAAVNAPHPHIRSVGKMLKSEWQDSANVQSFKSVTFIHWADIDRAFDLLRKPVSKDELSVLPYKSKPWTPLQNLSGMTTQIIGVIVKGWPTLVANADLNSNAFKKSEIPDKEMPRDVKNQRQASSGWNKYPGPRSPGSKLFFDTGTEYARSWDDYLVYSADEIAPHEKISFDALGVFRGTDPRGWPEALLDNWKPVGIVIPDITLDGNEFDDFVYTMGNHGIPAGLTVYDERGEKQGMTE